MYPAVQSTGCWTHGLHTLHNPKVGSRSHVGQGCKAHGTLSQPPAPGSQHEFAELRATPITNVPTHLWLGRRQARQGLQVLQHE